MIPDIQEINFPSYATISSATATLSEMGDKTIQAQVKIDGAQEPNFSGRTGTTAHGTDWEVEFKGERYIQPLRKPQMAKGNDSIMSVITLTFHHWAIYQLQRYLFCTLQQIDSNTAIADKYEASVSLNLYSFCKLLDDVIKFYFPGSPRPIYVDYSGVPQGGEVHTFEISKSYIWDVLINSYDIYGSRWTISADQSGNYKITFNAQQPVISDEFSYGHAGKLSRLERQVQDGEIRNQLIGRGGEKNIPYLYFRDYEKFHPGNTAYSNHGQIPDPDAIPELENVYFDRLRDANFRAYIQGWKVNTHRKASTDDGWSVTWNQAGTTFTESDGTTYSVDSSRMSTDWAYAKGATDTAFDPVEYVKDDASINTYGLLQGGLEDNDDIYPTIQGMTIEDACIVESHGGHSMPTRADETVEVEQVYTDEIKQDTLPQADIISEDLAPSTRITEVEAIDIRPAVSLMSKMWVVRTTSIASTFFSVDSVFNIPDDYFGSISLPVSVSAVANLTFSMKYHLGLLQYSDIGSVSKQVGIDIIGTELNPVSYMLYRKSGNDYQIVNNWRGERLSPGDYRLRSTVHKSLLYKYIPGNFLEGDYKNCYISGITVDDIVLSAQIVVNKYKLDGEVLSGSSASTVTLDAGEKSTLRWSIQEDVSVQYGETRSIYDVAVNVAPSELDPNGPGAALQKVRYYLEDIGSGDILDSTIRIPPGDYTLHVEAELENTDAVNSHMFVVSVSPILVYDDVESDSWKPTFDIWIKNIFGTNRADFPAGDAGDSAYVNAVWQPLVAAQDMTVVFTSGNLSGHSDWEFKLAADGIHYDPRYQYVIDEDEGCIGRSEWRLTLIKTDAEKDAIHKYVPYKGFNANKGDTFYIAGINLPWSYVTAAEMALRANKTSALEQTADTVPTWAATLDKVAIFEGNTPFANQIVPGAIIEIDDDRFGGEQQDLMIETVSYTWQDGSQGLVGLGLPTVEMTITKELRTTGSTVQQIQGQIDELSSQVRNMTNLERLVKDICDSTYLRKNGVDDISYSPTVMAAPMSSQSYAPGQMSGKGWAVSETEDGTSYAEVDVLTVRKEMRISTLVVNQISTRSGLEILSAANITVTKVDVMQDSQETGYYAPGSTEIFYRCYYENKNFIASFEVDDVAMCKRFSSSFQTAKYYKRLVLGVGNGYIDLTNIPADVDGTGAPEAGDVIVQYGNVEDEDNRGYVIERNVIGTAYERMLRGLNTVSSTGNEFFFAGLADDGYGSKTPRVFIGDAEGYVEYINNVLTVCGEIIVTNPTSGNSANIGYLPELLTADDTAISGGVVLSTIIGVKNASDNLVAALNASSLGADNAQGGHGKLLIFAGSANASGASSATTRIYEDGHIVANDLQAAGAVISGNITASTGSIGRFVIDSEGIVATDTTTYTGRTQKMSLYNKWLEFLDSDGQTLSNTNHYIQVLLGTIVGGTTDSTTGVNVSIKRNGRAWETVFNTGLRVDVEGNYASNIAIDAISGMFKGFRPYIRIQNTTDSISPEDCVIYCENSSEIGLSLPTSPQDGQFYIILHRSTTNLKIIGRLSNSSPGHQIRIIRSDDWLDNIADFGRGAYFFWYSASLSQWIATYILINI